MLMRFKDWRLEALTHGGAKERAWEKLVLSLLMAAGAFRNSMKSSKLSHCLLHYHFSTRANVLSRVFLRVLPFFVGTLSHGERTKTHSPASEFG